MAEKRKFSGDPVMVENVTLNWADTLFKRDEGENGNKKFGCDLLIDKNDEATVRALQQSLLPIYRKGCAEGTLDTATVKEFYAQGVHGEPIDYRDFGWPIKDGDAYADAAAENGHKRDEYRGKWYLAVSSANKPRLYDREANEIEDEQAARRKFYSGAKVNADLFAVIYEPGSFVRHGGIALWLNGLQFVADGERLGGGSRFKALAPTPMPTAGGAAPADADDGWDSL